MNLSPFVYGKTVSDSAFTNRSAECQKLQSNLLQGVNTAIISPRRWGKSSLVEKVVQDIRAEKHPIRVVMIDLFTVSSETEFLELFAREVLRASSTKWQEWLENARELFKQLIPKISVGVDPLTDFSVSFDWAELEKHKDEVLDLPEALARKNGQRFLICLDEFQNLATFRDYEALEKRLRAIWQRQKRVTYCLYGSKRHMMQEIFDNASKPFYRFGDIMLLGKISEADWMDFVQQSFRATGKAISPELSAAIARLMKNHPWYVQQLSHYLWQKTEHEAGEAQLSRALEELIHANMPLYQKEVEDLSSTQLNLLKAVSQGEQRLTSGRVMRDYALGTPRNVSKNKSILVREDLIHQTADGLEFTDPAFELWFHRVFFKRSYPL